MPDEFRNRKVQLLRGCFFSKWPKGQNQFFAKKIFWPKFFKIFFAHLIGNFFPIPKWSDFLIIAQNWPIYGGFSFTLLKTGYFPISRRGSPEAPLGVKICPKMVPTILTGHIMKVYDEKWAQKNFEISKCLIIQIQSHMYLYVWCNKFNPAWNSFQFYLNLIELRIPCIQKIWASK